MERYTPGFSNEVTRFMARRSLPVEGAFFRPHLWPGMRVLDCGCGPGTITAGITASVAPGGEVVAIDGNSSQVELARANLAGCPGVECRAGNIYGLPFPDASFDAVFSHAVFEHLSDPVGAAREVLRVLKPQGIFGLRSPDWTGKLAGPPSVELDEALEFYAELQASNGGNLRVGRRLGSILTDAGFARVRMTASYECYSPVSLIGEYLARQVETAAPGTVYAQILHRWQAQEGAFFAQSWGEALGKKVG